MTGTSGTTTEARRFIDVGDFANAEKILRDLVRQPGATREVHALLAYALLHINKPQESLKEYTIAAQLEQPSALELRSVGEDYVLLNDLVEADRWTRQALLLDEHDPETWYSLGRIRFSLQRFQEAIQCFTMALKLQPHSVKIANNLGLALEGVNQTDLAIEQYRHAVQWQSASAHRSEQPLLNLAIALVHQGSLTEALPLLLQAASIAPNDARIQDQLGHLYLQQAELAAARRCFEKAIALRPESSAYHFLLGQVLRREGLSSESEREFKLASALTQTQSTPQN